MQRTHIQTGTPWEEIAGYSRAIKVGNVIEVAGTTAMDGNIIIGKNDIESQTRFVFQKIQNTLLQLNSSLNDIIRTRMFVTDISKSEIIIKVHGEFFKDIKPVSSLLEISRLIDPDLLIEIEATAMVG